MKSGKLYSLLKSIICVLSIFAYSEQMKAQIPTVQDCLGAIPVCQYTYSQPLVYQGSGNYPNEINPNQECPQSCVDGEVNTTWYVISVKTGGILRFVISPVNSSDDYDWAVYCLNDFECSDIYTNAMFMQSSCNAAGGNGYHGPTGISTPNGGTRACNNGGNTNKWSSDLNVQTGDTYVLCVSNWTAASSAGYTVDFSASTADIFDDVSPVITAIDTVKGCSGSATVNMDFSENVLCSSVEASDFTLTGPDGTNHFIGSVEGAGCIAGGEQEKFFSLKNFSPPLTINGIYTLTLSGTVMDLCTNPSLVHSVNFIAALDPLPTVTDGPDDFLVPIGGIAKFSVQTVGANTFKWQSRSGGTGFFTDLAEGAPFIGTTNDTLIINPATMDLGEYQFRCVVSGECTPPAQSDPATLFVGDALAASASASPGVICIGESTHLNVSAFGGNILQPYSYLWTSPDGYSSTLEDPVVEPTVTTTYSVVVDDGYNPVTVSVTVTVHPLPVANAGYDQEINHGTFTTLNGNVPGGTAPVAYLWQPSDSLWNNTLQNPVTRKLRGSTLFTLVATDGNGCISLPDEVIVNVTGGPLNASPSAEPGEICFGDTTQLHALPSGGEFDQYSYSWLVNGVEFSTDPDPVVIPAHNTAYTLILDDSFNQVTRTVNVIVNPLPVVNLLKPEYNVVNGVVQLCVFDSLSMNPGYLGGEYLWDNGAATFDNLIATSGISFDYQEHYVRVTEPITGCVSSDTVAISFTFTACSYGLSEISLQDLVKIFPNPAGSAVTLSIDGPSDDYVIELTDLCGRLILKEELHKTTIGILNHQINLKSIASTTCLVRISSKQGIVVKKLVVAH